MSETYDYRFSRFKLVPLDPTREMLRAAAELQGDDQQGSLLRQGYVAMVNAAPPAPNDRRHRPIDQAQEKLLAIMIGGCTCNTKTPVLIHHDERCHFRLAAEVGDLLGWTHQ